MAGNLESISYINLGSGNHPIDAVTVGGKTVPDVSSFITKSVNDLTNYYLKSETYTKSEVESLIGAILQFHYEIAANTSAVTSPASNVLYLIGPTGSGADKYEEYVYPNSTAGWTKIGDTSIDLSGYVTTSVMQSTVSTITSTLSNLNDRLEVVESKTESDPVFATSIAASISSSDISNWNSKTSNSGTLVGVTFNGTTATISNGIAYISVSINESGSGLPSVSSADNGKILMVSEGSWTLVSPTSIYSGSATPNNSIGDNGDIYLQS